VGPNGSGKTTLIRILLGIAGPLSGRVRLFGQDLGDFSDWSRIGYLPQSFPPSIPTSRRRWRRSSLSAASRARASEAPGRSDHEAIDRALHLLNIDPIRTALIGELSGGQKQRVLIARAIVNNPDLLILDEPRPPGPEAREHFFTLLRRLNADRGTVIILVTHDVGSIGEYANKLMYVDRRIHFFAASKTSAAPTG